MLEIGLGSSDRPPANGPCGSPGPWSPRRAGVFQLALAQAGLARLLVNDEVVLDGFTNQPPPGGSDFFGQASQDLVTDVPFEKGVPAEFVVEYASRDTTLAGFRVGFRTPDTDALLERAVAAAAAADVAIVCVGTTEETETEGRDRTAFALPGRQDELIRRVAAVNDRTVVVVNAGVPGRHGRGRRCRAPCCSAGSAGRRWPPGWRTCSWERRSRGVVCPPPSRCVWSTVPSHANFPGENGELRYGEGLFMGYRGYEHNAIAPRFPFGHGLSYTTFQIGEPTLSADDVPARRDADRLGAGHQYAVHVAGSEVVQCYVAPASARLARPPKELKAFAKVWLEPGETTAVELVLDAPRVRLLGPGSGRLGRTCRRSFPRCSTSCRHRCHAVSGGGTIDAGRYDVLIGRSSEDIAVSCTIQVPDDANWR